MNRNLTVVLAVIAVAAIGFVLLSPKPQTTSSAATPTTPSAAILTTPSATPPSPIPAAPIPTSLEVAPLVIEGGIDLPLEGEVRVAVLIGTDRVADAAAPGGKFRLTLPAKLTDAPLNALSDISLPHGDGRLQPANALGATARVFAYQDINKNARLDEGEPSVEGALSKSGIAPDVRGFYKNQLVLTSKTSSLNEAQDSRTGAKGYYRYKLDLNPGWHVIQGEFGSDGYDVREAAGSDWDLVVPFKPSAPGPKVPQQ